MRDEAFMPFWSETGCRFYFLWFENFLQLVPSAMEPKCGVLKFLLKQGLVPCN